MFVSKTFYTKVQFAFTASKKRNKKKFFFFCFVSLFIPFLLGFPWILGFFCEMYLYFLTLLVDNIYSLLSLSLLISTTLSGCILLSVRGGLKRANRDVLMENTTISNTS